MAQITEKVLLDQAITAFQNEVGLPLRQIPLKAHLGEMRIGGVIELPEQNIQYLVEIKRRPQNANLGAIANQIKGHLPQKGLLITEYINPNMAEKLRELDVEFIDTAGNAYINQPPLHIWVKGNKVQHIFNAEPRETVNQAFGVAGLKVTYQFLCNPDLLNATQREIAQRADVALGAVGKVLKGLKQANYIIETRGKGKRLNNTKRLLDRWVETYPEKLRPKLKVGDFIAQDPYWWEHQTIFEFGAYWGGEVAAAKYAGYLKPKNTLVYLPEKAGNTLLAKTKLKKAITLNDGPVVSIYRPFWNIDPVKELTARIEGKTVDQKNGLVHPILVYADLIATGDSRNREAAIEIYERFIAPIYKGYL